MITSKSDKKAFRDDLTKEKFDEAVSTLNKQGKKLTIRAIKELVGGANETISAFMRQYNKTIMEASFNETMPESFQQDMQRVALNLFESFRDKINADRSRLQNEYDAKHKEIGELMSEAQKELHLAQEKLKEQDAQIAKKDERIKELESLLAEQTKTNAHLTKRLEQQSDDKQQAILEAIARLGK